MPKYPILLILTEGKFDKILLNYCFINGLNFEENILPIEFDFNNNIVDCNGRDKIRSLLESKDLTFFIKQLKSLSKNKVRNNAFWKEISRSNISSLKFIFMLDLDGNYYVNEHLENLRRLGINAECIIWKDSPEKQLGVKDKKEFYLELESGS